MPIYLDINSLTAENIQFMYSPFNEMLLSLHTLHDYRHHPLHISWALDKRKVLSDEMKARIQRYSFLMYKIMGLSLEVLYHDNMESIEASFVHFEALPLEDFLEPIITGLVMLSKPKDQFMQPRYDLEILQDTNTMVTINEWLQKNFPDSMPILDLLEHNPQQIKQEFGQLLRDYWYHYFEEDWLRIEPLFRSDIQSRGTILFEGELKDVLDSVGKDFMARDDGTVVKIDNNPANHITYTKDDNIFLMPSYFLWPHTIFTHTEIETKSTMIIYALPHIAKKAQPPLTDEELLAALRATANHVRLQILRLLSIKPRSNKELASILQLSESATSKHIKDLESVGWISAKRQSYYVLYEINKSKADEIHQGIQSYLS